MYQILYSEANSAIDTATANGIDVGITLDYGNGLVRVSFCFPSSVVLDFDGASPLRQALLWSANALLYLSIVPYVVACCTGRNSKA
jgi:hypothetical protein